MNEEIDREVKRALRGDHQALMNVFKKIAVQLELGSGPSIEPDSLRGVYDIVLRGTLRCARSQGGKLRAPGVDLHAALMAVAMGATAAWFLDNPRRRPPWNPELGASLEEFVEDQAQRYVMTAIGRVIREMK